MLTELEIMSSEDDEINLVVKPGVVFTEAALMFDMVYVLAYALQKLEKSVRPVRKQFCNLHLKSQIGFFN